MHKFITFLRYLKDYLQYGQILLVFVSIIYLLTGKAYPRTRLFRGKLGLFLHRKGSLDFQFGNYAYEWGVKQFFLKHYIHYQAFIDVGANMGTYTIMFAKKGMKTIAFEPSISNFKALQINIMLNDLERKVSSYNLGLDSKNHNASFVFDPVNTGASHLSSAQFHDPVTNERGEITEVQLVMLDFLQNNLPLHVNDAVLMKIDVEGMEEHVILGAKDFIQNRKELLIVMESVHSGEEKLKAVLSEIAEFEFLPVDSLNFAAKKIKNHNPKKSC
ncbi:MAG: FkbM family methyltransferase [Bacteroidales bacterium]|jgi:FkbM family methyltransferase|nr:FkbM family methyltransferase [Bacteroidales bacterium]HOI31159.1 FkbM family methyltransferase [Bacteroidales bacterium]